MGKYPVISISLKGVNADSFETAKALLVKVINREARRLQFLLDSEVLDQRDKQLFEELLCRDMDEEILSCSLQELTYKELYDSMDHIWSTLFMTGYLTHRGEPSGNRYNLAIPNREIRTIITERILKLFQNILKRICGSDQGLINMGQADFILVL